MPLESCVGDTPTDKSSVAWDGENVVFSGGNDYSPQCTARAFYVGTTGNVQVVTPAGHTVTYFSVAAGSIIPQSFIRMVAAGTSASQIVAMA